MVVTYELFRLKSIFWTATVKVSDSGQSTEILCIRVDKTRDMT